MTNYEPKTYSRLNYELNKEKILRKQRERYRKNKEYREACKRRARERYDALHDGVYRLGTYKSVEHGLGVIEIDGKIYFSIQYAAEAAQVHPITIRRWIQNGIIPEPLQEEGGRQYRWFTPHQLRILERFRCYKTMERRYKMAAQNYAKLHWERKYGSKAHVKKILERSPDNTGRGAQEG